MNIEIKLRSCFSESISYLGPMITPDKPHIACKTTEVIEDLQHLTTVSKLRQFLPSSSAYQHLVSKFCEHSLVVKQEAERNRIFAD